MTKIAPIEFVDESNKKSQENSEHFNQLTPIGKFSLQLLFNILISVAGGTFIVGWHIGLFNTPSEVIREFINQTYTNRSDQLITDEKLTLIWSLSNGLMPLGGSLGGLLTGFFIQRAGPRNSMFSANFIAVLTSIFYLISSKIKSYEILIVARFFTGFLSGFFCGIGPVYLNELAPVNLRGFLGTINALAICLGNLLANILGLPQLLGTYNLLPYYLGALPLVLSFVHIFGLPFCLESPKYLFITKNQPEKARKCLEKLHRKNSNLIEYEIRQLEIEKESSSNNNKHKQTSFNSFFKVKSLRNAMLVSIILQASQQFSGIIAVITYSTRIFISIGLNAKTWAIYAAIFLSFIETVCHLLCMFVIDRTGRRVLLLSGLIGMSICCFVLGLIQIFIDAQLWLKVLAVLAVTIYIIFYSFGPGPMPLLLTAELFDTETRPIATSIAVFLNWFFNFIVSVSFPYIEKSLGGYGFIIYGCLLILFATFTYLKCPETKNKTTQEIILYFEN